MRIFISYRRHDSQHTSYRIADRLRVCYGAQSVFIDIDNLPAGVDFRDAIKSEIESCDVVLVVIGPRWAENDEKSTIQDPSDWVRIEIETALQAKIQTIPVLVEGAAMPMASSLPTPIQTLAYLNAATIGEGRDFHNHVDWLIASINRRTRRLALFPKRGVVSRLSAASLLIIVLVIFNGGLLIYYRYLSQSGTPPVQPPEKSPLSSPDQRLTTAAANPPAAPSPPVSEPPVSAPVVEAPPVQPPASPPMSPDQRSTTAAASPPAAPSPPVSEPPVSAPVAETPPVQPAASPAAAPTVQASVDASPAPSSPVVTPAAPDPPSAPIAPDRSSTDDVCTVGGLDPNGNNWLALRDSPSFTSHWSNTHMGPGTQLTILGTSGEWRHVRLHSGEEGWASGHFIRCGDAPASPTPSSQCTVGGLDPNGDNWLALRRRPNFQSTWSKTHMGPGTQVTVLSTSGDWRHVRLESGEEGWANGRYLRCD